MSTFVLVFVTGCGVGLLIAIGLLIWVGQDPPRYMGSQKEDLK
jgi:hypothetical protein